MIKKIIQKRSVEVIEKYCDVCKNKSEKLKRCCMCNIDLCFACISQEVNDGGDYSDYYCNNCWDNGKLFRDKIKVYETEIDLLQTSWLKICQK